MCVAPTCTRIIACEVAGKDIMCELTLETMPCLNGKKLETM